MVKNIGKKRIKGLKNKNYRNIILTIIKYNLFYFNSMELSKILNKCQSNTWNNLENMCKDGLLYKENKIKYVLNIVKIKEDLNIINQNIENELKILKNKIINKKYSDYIDLFNLFIKKEVNK